MRSRSRVTRPARTATSRRSTFGGAPTAATTSSWAAPTPIDWCARLTAGASPSARSRCCGATGTGRWSMAELDPMASFRLDGKVAVVTGALGGSGSIVNVASMLGLVGVGQLPQAPYAATKGGLLNLTRELAAEWARKGVRVNALCPGYFHTEMNDQLLTTESGDKWVRGKTPM